MKYIVLIADIVSSRKLKLRDETQENLKRTLDEVNKRSSNEILSPYTITLGDEFQAVYKKADSIIKDIFYILVRTHPIKIRFSISYGDIVTEINNKESIGMDGEAFYLARDKMTSMKDLPYSVINFSFENNPDEKLINNGLLLAMSVISEWNENAMIIFNEIYNGKAVKNIVPELNISERAIYKTINSKKIKIFNDYFVSIQEKLKKEVK